VSNCKAKVLPIICNDHQSLGPSPFGRTSEHSVTYQYILEFYDQSPAFGFCASSSHCGLSYQLITNAEEKLSKASKKDQGISSDLLKKNYGYIASKWDSAFICIIKKQN
jgi:hypothetical protein